jgi:uncharacterized protein (TIGR02466 family)
MESRLRMLWASPFLEAKFPDHDRVKHRIVDCCLERERRAAAAIESGVTPARKQNLYESRFDFFQASVPEVRQLGLFCAQTISQFILQQNKNYGGKELPPFGVDIFESWCHVTRDDGYHDVHTHPNCSWCGIYYVDPGEAALPSNGVNRFYSPVDLTYDDLGVIASPHMPFSIAPEAGKLVLFPSYVRHAGLPYRGTRERILIAFNARIVPVPVEAPQRRQAVAGVAAGAAVV